MQVNLDITIVTQFSKLDPLCSFLIALQVFNVVINMERNY